MMCPTGYFQYQTYVASLHVREGNPAEAKAALMAHAANCPKCAEIVRESFRKSKPLPEVETR